MFRQTKDEIVPLTRTLAEDFATMRGVPGERKLSNARQNFLRARYDDGKFHTPVWAVAVLGGVRHRVNGQHSSNMLLSLNGHFPIDRRVHLMEFSCDSQEDLAELFAQFDAKDSARSYSDILTSHGRIHAELNDVSPTSMATAVSGIAYALNLNKKVGTDERARLVHAHQGFVIWANPFVKFRGISRAPVVGAMFDTYHKSRDAATEFWTLVKDESHADVNHPSRVLSRFLRDAIVQEKEHRGAKKWSPRAFYTKCVHAWNAYRRGQRTQLKCYDTENAPDIV